MKDSELAAVVKTLGPCVIAEYRGGLTELVEWVDPNDGKVKPYIRSVHSFEVLMGQAVLQLKLSQPVAKTILKVADVPQFFERGKLFLIKLLSLENEKGNLKGRINPDFVPVEIS